MKVESLPISGLYLVECTAFVDERGVFARFFCEQELGVVIGARKIEQINFSRNLRKGTIRGLHFQRQPMAEMKFIRCIRGKIFDVAVDIRKGSPTFLQWYGVELTQENMKMLCVPEGFAHGFQVLEEESELLYLHTAPYAKEHEGALHYADPAVGVDWPVEGADISIKDQGHLFLETSFEGIIV